MNPNEAIRLCGMNASKGINPDEAIVFGAAVQGDILANDNTCRCCPPTLLHPFSLGIETTGGKFTRVIRRNSVLPTQKSQFLSTSVHNQSTVLIQVFEGDRSMSRNNKLLGKLMLSGIEPARRGVPEIQVSFDLNDDGALQVSARDKSTGKNESIKITIPVLDLSWEEREEIEMAVQEGEKLDQIKADQLEFSPPSRLEEYALSLKELTETDVVDTIWQDEL